MQNQTRWHCIAGDKLLWEHWDEESLLYDCRSGQTHSLTPLAVEVVLLLQTGEFSLEEITGKLSNMFSGIQLPANEIHDLLDHFEALGLIEACQR